MKSPLLKEGDKLLTKVYEGCTTLVQNLQYIVNKMGDKKAYGYRRVIKEHIEKDITTRKNVVTLEHGPMKWMSFKEAFETEQWLAAGVKKFAPEIKEKGFFGIYLNTCVEWTLQMFANTFNNITTVTLYANLGSNKVTRIINQTNLSILMISAKSLEMIDRIVAPQCKSLKKVVIVGLPPSNYTVKNLKIIQFYDLVALGKKNPIKWSDFPLPNENDIAYMMFTSGTTGEPKGVILSQKNVVSAIAGKSQSYNISRDNPTDVHLSYLPMAHIYELVVQNVFFFLGCKVGFGSPRSLMKKPGGAKYIGDLKMVKPTIIIGVPRGGVEEMLFRHVLEKKIEMLKKKVNEKVDFEEYVFREVRELLGGKIRVILCGGAPLSGETQRFFQAAMGPKVSFIQGYGCTETGASAITQLMGRFQTIHNIGWVLRCNYVKLRDIPDLKYFVSEGKGEIIVGGPIIAQGYYKMEKRTKEVFLKDDDGIRWFCTGDVGKVHEDGSFTIIDRVKNLVKLSTGEYVSLEELEMYYGNSGFCAPNGLVVFADSLQNFVVGIVRVDMSFVETWAQDNGIKYKNFGELIKKKKLYDVIFADFQRIAKENQFLRLERLEKFTLVSDDWNPQNGMYTSAMKKKRNNIQKKYQKEIDEMYGK